MMMEPTHVGCYFQINSFCSCCFFFDSGAFLKVSSVTATVDGRSIPLPSINSFTVRSWRRGRSRTAKGRQDKKITDQVYGGSAQRDRRYRAKTPILNSEL